MEQYATKQATLGVLISLGFIPIPNQDHDGRHFFLDSPKDDENDFPIVQVSIYKCNNGYYCVDVDDGWKAPCVWNGPKADWDKTDTTQEFVSFLDKNYPGWR